MLRKNKVSLEKRLTLRYNLNIGGLIFLLLFLFLIELTVSNKFILVIEELLILFSFIMCIKDIVTLSKKYGIDKI